MSFEWTIKPVASERPQASRPATARAVRDGFELFLLSNGELELAVVPALGAKVVSLQNLRSGREWLWHPASGLKLFPNQPGDDFSRSTLVGWDECLPTIAPCTWRGRALPDHGEAWTQAWKLDQNAWADGVLKTSVHLPVSGFKFTRTLSLSGGTSPPSAAATAQVGRSVPDRRRGPADLRNRSNSHGAPGRSALPAEPLVSKVHSTVTVEYVLENPTASAQEFVWAIHPLLALQPGDQLELTEETRSHLPEENWLDSLNFAAGSASCAKVYAGPLKLGRAGVSNSRTGDRLTFEWNTAECDTLGLWLTRGGWHGHHHLALEPAIGAADSLADAASQSRRCGVLPPHTTKTWHLQLHIQS